MKKFTTDEYVKELRNCNSESYAEILGQALMSDNSSSTKGAYSPSIPVTWSMFYALVDLENRFGLPHTTSAYAAIDLITPKIASTWTSKKATMNRAEIDDYLEDLYFDLVTNYIDKWDPKKNNNFLAFIIPELSTTANVTAAPEINPYLQKKKGYSSLSLDGLNDSTEGGFEAEDPNSRVDEDAMRNIECEKLGLMGKIIKDDGKKITGSKEEVKKAILADKLLGGIRSLEEDVIDALNEFFTGEEEPELS